MGIAEHALGLSMGMSGDFEKGVCVGGRGRETRREGVRAREEETGVAVRSAIRMPCPVVLLSCPVSQSLERDQIMHTKET